MKRNLYRFMLDGNTFTSPADVIISDWIYISWLHAWLGPTAYELVGVS